MPTITRHASSLYVYRTGPLESDLYIMDDFGDLVLARPTLGQAIYYFK